MIRARSTTRSPASVSSDLARVALDQLDAELLLELLDLGRQRRLAHEAGLGGPAEVAVVGDGHQVARGRAGSSVDLRSRSRDAARSATAVAARRSAGADVRIRWSKALSAAVEPAPMAMTICLYGTVVQSPAANTPGTEVWPRSSITISPRGDSSTVAVEPLGVRQQADLHEDAVEVDRCDRRRSVRSVVDEAGDLARRRRRTSVVSALTMTSTLGRLRSLRCSTSSARSCVVELDQRDVGDDAGEVDGGLDAGVAAADHRDALALEQRAVAVRAVGDALVAVLVLAGHVHLAPAGAGGQHDRCATAATAPLSSSTRDEAAGLVGGHEPRAPAAGS